MRAGEFVVSTLRWNLADIRAMCNACVNSAALFRLNNWAANELGLSSRFRFGDRVVTRGSKVPAVVVVERLYARADPAHITPETTFRGFCFRNALCYYPQEHKVRERASEGLLPVVSEQIASEHRQHRLTSRDGPPFLLMVNDIVRRRSDRAHGYVAECKHIPSTPLTNFYRFVLESEWHDPARPKTSLSWVAENRLCFLGASAGAKEIRCEGDRRIAIF